MGSLPCAGVDAKREQEREQEQGQEQGQGQVPECGCKIRKHERPVIEMTDRSCMAGAGFEPATFGL